MKEHKHTIQDLKGMQMLSLKNKVLMTEQRIKEWYKGWNGKVFVSISGKDSTVLLHIARSLYPDIKAVYVDTGLEYNEVRQLAMSHDNVDIIRPKKVFTEVIKEYGYPIISKEVSECIENSRKCLSGGV